MSDPIERDAAARLAHDAIETGSTDELVARVVLVERRLIAEYLRSPAALAVAQRHASTGTRWMCTCAQSYQEQGSIQAHLLDELAKEVDR